MSLEVTPASLVVLRCLNYGRSYGWPVVYHTGNCYLELRGCLGAIVSYTSAWLHSNRDGFSNPRRLDCLHNRLFRHRSKKTSKLRVTGLCEGNSPVTSEFPAQRASNAEKVPIWWRHHITAATWRCRKLISQWQYSFHLKVEPPLVKRFALASESE